MLTTGGVSNCNGVDTVEVVVVVVVVVKIEVEAVGVRTVTIGGEDVEVVVLRSSTAETLTEIGEGE